MSYVTDSKLGINRVLGFCIHSNDHNKDQNHHDPYRDPNSFFILMPPHLVPTHRIRLRFQCFHQRFLDNLDGFPHESGVVRIEIF